MATERGSMFSAPTWLRDLGFGSWLLVGFVLIILGLVWLLDQTSTIVMPVVLALVLGAVAGPIVGVLERRGLPRAAGAGLVLLGLVVIGALVFALIVHGISANSSEISSKASRGLDTIEGWLKDMGVDDTKDQKDALEKDLPEIRETLVNGVAAGVGGLTSVAFFLAFATLGTFFVLKDAPVMARFTNSHMGVPEHVAQTVTSEVVASLRRYFTGVTIIAAFNGLVVGLGALVLGVPLAGTIAIVTFVTAYVPFIGAWAAGIFAFAIALGTEGTSDALILGLIILLANGALQNILQPFVFGATLSLNPLVVLVVTIAAGSLFGMVGLTLAAPLTSAAVHISGRLREGGQGEPAAAGPKPSPEPLGA
jgi:predicted PurR-regulated permease PerM